MKFMRVLAIATLLIATTISIPVQAEDKDDLEKLLETGKCRKCDLEGADLSGKDLVRSV
ncbi:MAG: hypothetical protein WBA93_14600 [Microcoleaceae cyanobacterium]